MMNMTRVLVPLVGVLGLSATGALAQQVFATSVSIQGSLCVGDDCTNAENFGFDTIRLKENNTRIKFDDTSASGSFPFTDWQLTANDSDNGGLNKFSIEDITNARVPFTVEALAPTNSLYVEDSGQIGFGTDNPAVELHAVDGDTPTLRLEQDGSSGFTAQTWDLAGNETNFFVRNVTNGSALPIRVSAAAQGGTLLVGSDGKVGIGFNTNSGNLTNLGANLEVRGTETVSGYFHGNGIKLLDLQSDNNQPVQYRMKSDSTNRRFVALNGSGSVKTQLILGDSEFKLAGVNDTTELLATFSTSGMAIGAPGLKLLDVKSTNSQPVQMRLLSDSANRRIVALNAAGAPKSQIIMGDNQVKIAGSSDASALYATFSAAGIVTNIGSCTNASPCDAVFDPEVYEVPSIEDHASAMWKNRYLPAVGPTANDQPVNLTAKMTGMLNELEHAHIYIEQLNKRIAALEAAQTLE